MHDQIPADERNLFQVTAIIRNKSAFLQTTLSFLFHKDRVASMKTAHTLILLRQHVCQCLVSPRLHG
jgi:hypothetical protein